jgi:hypothetical protein
MSDTMQDLWRGDLQNIDYQDKNEIQENEKIHRNIRSIIGVNL